MICRGTSDINVYIHILLFYTLLYLARCRCRTTHAEASSLSCINLYQAKQKHKEGAKFIRATTAHPACLDCSRLRQPRPSPCCCPHSGAVCPCFQYYFCPTRCVQGRSSYRRHCSQSNQHPKARAYHLQTLESGQRELKRGGKRHMKKNIYIYIHYIKNAVDENLQLCV